MNQESKSSHCPKCGAKLELKVCFECGGTGSQGMWLWKTKCGACGGKKLIPHCPNESAHIKRPFTSFGFGRVRPTTCPKCGRKAKLIPCLACAGKGKYCSTVPGQWGQKDLRRNPFLPYYASPPSRIILNSCSECNGTGEIVFCSVCAPPHLKVAYRAEGLEIMLKD